MYKGYNIRLKQVMLHKLSDILVLNDAELQLCNSIRTVKKCIMELLEDKDITDILNQLHIEIEAEFTDDNKAFRDITEIVNFYNKELTCIKNNDIMTKLKNMLERKPLYFIGRICTDHDLDNTIPDDCGLIQQEYENLLELTKLIKQFIDNNYE